MTYFVGVDVGGTTSTVAIGGDRRNALFVSPQFATHATEGPEKTLAAVVEQVVADVRRCGGDLADVAGVCIATPGPATLDGILLKTPNLNPKYWDRYPIRQELQQALGRAGVVAPVHYVGDGQAAALGEYAVRSGALTLEYGPPPIDPVSDLHSLFMVIVGTGLGGGEIRNGRVVQGREGRAGHAGHLLLPHYAFRYDHDRTLVVGNAPCTVESAVSLTALTHQLAYRLGLDAWKDHSLNSAPGTPRDKAKQLRELAAAGDPLALELFDDQARALGLALLNVNYLGDYDLLVIGGGVCDLSPEVRERYRQLAEETYRQYALDGFRNLSHFEFSACGDAAPVLGALAQAQAKAHG